MSTRGSAKLARVYRDQTSCAPLSRAIFFVIMRHEKSRSAYTFTHTGNQNKTIFVYILAITLKRNRTNLPQLSTYNPERIKITPNVPSPINSREKKKKLTNLQLFSAFTVPQPHWLRKNAKGPPNYTTRPSSRSSEAQNGIAHCERGAQSDDLRGGLCSFERLERAGRVQMRRAFSRVNALHARARVSHGSRAARQLDDSMFHIIAESRANAGKIDSSLRSYTSSRTRDFARGPR